MAQRPKTRPRKLAAPEPSTRPVTAPVAEAPTPGHDDEPRGFWPDTRIGRHFANHADRLDALEGGAEREARMLWRRIAELELRLADQGARLAQLARPPLDFD